VSEPVHIHRRRRVSCPEGDEDLAVFGADQGSVAEREVDAAVRDPHVGDHGRDLLFGDLFADELFDACDRPLRLLDPRPGRPAHVESDLAGVDRGEEVATDEGNESDGGRDERREARKRDATVLEDPRQAEAVDVPCLLEARVERVVDAPERASVPRRIAMNLVREEVPDHRRHERPREQIGGAHGEHDRERQRGEEGLAAPVRNATGAKTMQMHSVDTNAGIAICAAPSRIAWTIGFLWARFL